MISAKEEHILVAAERLFAEKGFDATSIREISAAANVNVSMISYYFGSKEQLLEKLFEYRMLESTNFSQEVLTKDLDEGEKLMAIVNLYIIRVQKLQNFYQVLQREQITNKNPHITQFMNKSKLSFLLIYRKLLDDGYEKGIFTKKPRVDFLHATLIGTVFYTINSIKVYSAFAETSEAEFRQTLFEDLNHHLKQLLKNLLGYDEN